jgi:hypothetical protein
MVIVEEQRQMLTSVKVMGQISLGTEVSGLLEEERGNGEG